MLRSPGGRRLAYHWVRGTGSFPHELLRATLALDRGPTRRSEPAVVVQVSTPLAGEDEAQFAEAERRLRAFLQHATPALRNYGAL